MTAPAKAAANEPQPILRLSTLEPLRRPFIEIDGVRYNLRTPAEFGILSLNRLDQKVAEVDRLQARQKGAGPLSDKDALQVTAILKSVVAEVLDAPEEVRERLSDLHRLAVLQAFTPASRATATPAKPNRAARRRTGATSSRASRASTARPTG